MKTKTIKNIIGQSLTAGILTLSCLSTPIALAGEGALLGITPGVPLIDYTGTTGQGCVYDADNDLLTITGTPGLTAFALPILPPFSFISGGNVTMTLNIDDAGVLSGGAFSVTGTVTDPAGPTLYGSPLLTGTFTGGDYGIVDTNPTAGGTDQADARAVLINGSLAPLYSPDDIGITITMENSDFIDGYGGTMTEDWACARAKGVIGTTPPGEAQCDVTVEKTCCIPPPPQPGIDNCQGKVVRAVFEYTGETCASLSNPQEGKAVCTGDLDGEEPVSIVVTKDEDKVAANPSAGVTTVDPFNRVEFTRTDGDDFGSETKFDVIAMGGASQSLNIHTSCSKALSVGDQFGSMKLVELETTEGGVVTLPSEDGGTSCEPPGHPLGTQCDSRLTELVVEYIAAACEDPLANPQDGKAECIGAAPVGEASMLYTGKDPDKITLDKSSMINDGDIIRITATGRDELHSATKLQISDAGGIAQTIELHTSCSQPLALGDTFGSLRVVEFTTKDGGTKTLADPDAQVFFESCELPTAPPGPHCTSKLNSLTLRYIGGECADEDNTQDKDECTGDDPGADVSITFTKDADRRDADPSSDLNIGDLFTITAPHDDHFHELGSETKFDATGAGGATQSLNIHTSCSNPLNLGDTFGAFEVFSMDRKDEGVVSLGGQVEYQYTINNLGTDPVDVTSVYDDKLHEILGTSPLGIAGSTSTTLYKTATLLETTTNTATVTVEQGGTFCAEPVSNEVTVTLVEPPAGPFTCDKPIDELTMIWNGTQDIRVRVWKGNVGDTLLHEEDNVLAPTAPGAGDGTEVMVSGFAGSPNDVYWEIFAAGTTGTDGKLGDSVFHMSCSDDNMNGPEDCGKDMGNSKGDDEDLINSWLLEGMVDNSGEMNCTPD